MKTHGFPQLSPPPDRILLHDGLQLQSRPRDLACSLAWALDRLNCGRIDPLQLCQPTEDGSTPLMQLERACEAFGLTMVRMYETPGESSLPLLCWTETRGWGVVTGRTASGLWSTIDEHGGANFAEMALRNACVLVRPVAQAVPLVPPARCRPASAPSAAACAAPVRRGVPLCAGAICMPGMPFDWENVGLVLLLLLLPLTIVVGLRAMRRVLRVARRGHLRFHFMSRWIEGKRLSKQRERFLRQAIRSSQSAPYSAHAPARRNGQGSI